MAREPRTRTSSFLSEDPTSPDISTTVPTTRATTSWRDILPSSTTRHLHLLRALLLATAAFASALLTVLGFWLILWLLVTRSFAPPSATHTQKLDFDIVDNALVGIAHFTPPSSFSSLPYKSPLYPGQTAEIVVQLHIPSTSAKGGLVQVVTELFPPPTTQQQQQQPFMRSSLPISLPPSTSWSLWTIASTPFRLLNIRSSSSGKYSLSVRPITVKPFSTYHTEPYSDRDKSKNNIKSLSTVKVVLKSRTGGGAIAEVIGGQVELRLKLGLVRRMLYMVRPGMLLTLLGWSVALTTASVGCLGVFISGSALMWAGPALVTEDDDGLTADQDELDYRARMGSGRVGGDRGESSPSSSFLLVTRSSDDDGDGGDEDDMGSDILYSSIEERDERRREREIRAIHTAELMERLYEDDEEEEEEGGERERRRVLRWRRNAAKMGAIPPPPSF